MRAGPDVAQVGAPDRTGAPPSAPGHRADLAVRRAELRRLRELFVRLSTVPLGTSGWALPNLVADSAAENARTQVLFATSATALSSGDTPAHPAVVEAELRPDGAVQLLRPAP